jgi:UDP-N-acetylglucosamine 1-carboxyvinyltransferase
MDNLLVRGGARLKGEVAVSGAKNAALPAMAASLLSAGTVHLERVPDLVDVKTMGRLLESMGMEYRFSEGSVELDASRVRSHVAPYEHVKTMRASVLVLCPLVARFGRARVSLPGGCAIGARPINLHIMGLEKMGASVKLEEGYVVAKAKRLRGARIYLDVPTVTGTENLMMAASLARGTTVIENAAREPEVVDLARLLNAMGAKIHGAGEGILTVDGVDELRTVRHAVIPDRIETGTFMAAAAVTGGDVTLLGADARHLDAVMLKFRESGVGFHDTGRGLRVTSSGRLSASDLKTMPYPGFPTDMQAQFMAMMSVAKGTSIIQERIFENRFMHVAELRRMGADISEEAGVATVRGGKALRGAEVMATDLRASASLVVAALAAHGTSTIYRLYHLDRGYDRIEEKLRRLGASVKRVKGRA